MASLDRRVLLAWAALATFLASFFAVGGVGQHAMLIALPFALIWLNRTTIGHARSFEDALRRIDEIERTVNGIAGEELLSFQSRHPSRSVAVGGRTGSDTVKTVSTTAFLMLMAGVLLQLSIPPATPQQVLPYASLCAIAAIQVAVHMSEFRRYRYDKRPDPERMPIIRPS